MQEAIQHYLEKHGFETLRLKTVLFDMDGVLYDSMPNHAVAWQESMAEFGIHMTKADAYATEGARGVDTIRMMVKKQKGTDIDEAEAQRMYDRKSCYFHNMQEAPVMPGILDLMEKIHASGVQIGVVTGSGQRPLINRLIKDFGRYLQEGHITTAYDVKKGKPNPDPYLMGLQKAGNLKPWEAVVVENAPLGVQAGAAANILTIAVNTGPLPDASLLNSGADLLFKSMTDLCNAWNNLFHS
jgi:HAD superfamily hydrolase (TIGR01509 family)